MYELELLNQMIYSPFTIERLFMAICCSFGIWADMKLFWMVIYQIKYGGNAGENYLRYGKKYLSSGSIGKVEGKNVDE